MLLSIVLLNEGMHNLIADYDDDIYVTTTVVIMERLLESDQVFVRMILDEKAAVPSSLIYATSKRDISFIGQKIGYLVN